MATRRSTRTRRPPESFEATTYAADILYAQIKNADTMDDFLSTLFLCFKPACYRPDLWGGAGARGGGEHGGIYRMTRTRCATVGLDHDTILRLALAYAKNELEVRELNAVLAASRLPRAEILEFKQTIGLSKARGDAEDEEEEDETETHEEDEEEDEEDDDYVDDAEEDEGDESDADEIDDEDDEDDEEEETLEDETLEDDEEDNDLNDDEDDEEDSHPAATDTDPTIEPSAEMDEE